MSDSTSEPTKSPVATATRLHDMDALRASAMLIGIAYHLSLSFAEGFPWLVQDNSQSQVYFYFQAWVHGFRMPLFFLISGYFMAMLWRKRGAWALVKHRFKRIFIPCMLGLVTIIPLTNLSIGYSFWTAGQVKGKSSKPTSVKSGSGEFADFWTAIGFGKLDGIRGMIEDGADVNALHPQFGSSPINYAALRGDVEIIQLLIDAGADVNRKNKDGNTALHSAAFFGQAEAFEMLLDSGADPSIRNNDGAVPEMSLAANWDTAKSIAGLVQYPLDRGEWVKGKEEIYAMLHPDDPKPNPAKIGLLPGEKASRKSSDKIEALIGALFLIPLFGHLWFLWMLCWFVGIFVIYAWIARKFGWPKGERKWLVSNFKWLWLIPLTMIPQSMMGGGEYVFGPDTALGVLPYPHVFLYYLIFFGYGVLYFDCKDPDFKIARGWKWMTPFTILIFFPLALDAMNGQLGWLEKLGLEGQQKFLNVAFQTMFTWLMVFSMLGLFRRFFGTHNNTMRYISDSSYWLYLIHLPLVILGQSWVRYLDWSPHLKFLVLNIGVIGVSVLAYQYCVRYTPIGTLLNGKRMK